MGLDTEQNADAVDGDAACCSGMGMRARDWIVMGSIPG